MRLMGTGDDLESARDFRHLAVELVAIVREVIAPYESRENVVV